MMASPPNTKLMELLTTYESPVCARPFPGSWGDGNELSQVSPPMKPLF